MPKSERLLEETRERKFADIYESNKWVYGSGVGSLPINNIDYIRFLRMFMERNNIRTVVDFGCGDWQFSQYIRWETVTYTGFDIVRPVIERNQSLFVRDVRSRNTPLAATAMERRKANKKVLLIALALQEIRGESSQSRFADPNFG